MANTKTPEGYIDVRVDNPAGQTVTVRLTDDEQGHDLAEMLRKRARREELERVQVSGNPQYRPRPQATADRAVVDDEDPGGVTSADGRSSVGASSADAPANQPRRTRRQRGAPSE